MTMDDELREIERHRRRQRGELIIHTRTEAVPVQGTGPNMAYLLVKTPDRISVHAGFAWGRN
jgi:hypothetical protein